MISLQAAVNNVALATKPPKHMRTKGNGKVGQKPSFERLVAVCEKRGFDPLEVVVQGCMSLNLDEKSKVEWSLKVMEYMYAKRKAVEVTGEDGGPVELVIKWAAEKPLK